MDLVTSLCAVFASSYQGASSHLISAATAACTKYGAHKGEISPADMAELNAAVEPGLGSSAALAAAYYKTIKHILWDAGADEQNRITAGVDTC